MNELQHASYLYEQNVILTLRWSNLLDEFSRLLRYFNECLTDLMS